MPIIETEIWKENPERPGTVIFDKQRKAHDIFAELKTHLIADGRMPDEYLLLATNHGWDEHALFPKDAEILCNVNYGSSEGVYIDILVRYDTDIYGYCHTHKEEMWQKKMVTDRFATGKTLGDSIEDLDKMHLVASSVMAAFYGNKAQVHERYTKIEREDEARVYPIPTAYKDLADEKTAPIKPSINSPEPELNIKISLAEKLETAGEKVKTQASKGDKSDSKKHDER